LVLETDGSLTTTKNRKRGRENPRPLFYGSAIIEPTKTTVGGFLNRWLRDCAETNTVPRTAERHKQMVDLHLIPNLGYIPLQQLRPNHLQTFYAKSLKDGRVDGKGGLSARCTPIASSILPLYESAY